MKHTEMDYRFVREKLESGILEFSHIGTQHQPAVIFTEALGKK